MSRASSSEGLRSEALRAALASALAGKPEALEDLLRRHGDGHGARPNLRLAAAFGAEISALPGAARRACSIGSARTTARPTRPTCSSRSPPRTGGSGGCGPIATSARPGTRWRCSRETNACPSGWARWPRWRRSPGVPAAGTRCWRGRSTGWSSTTARSASAPPAWSSRCSPTARRWPRSPTPRRCSTICRARSPRSPARRGRRSDRMRAGGCCSRCPGRWPAWRPACAPAIAARPGSRKSAGTPRHPDVRGALSKTILILADKSSGQGAALAQGLRAALEGSAKPPRDPTRIRPGAARGRSSRPMR